MTDKPSLFYQTMDGLQFLVYPDINPKQEKMAEIMLDFVAHGKAGYEPETTKIVKGLIKEGDVCVDVGASIGYFTLLMGRLVGKTGKVIAIEPVPEQHPYLAMNVITNGLKDRVSIYNVAASDKVEDKEMFTAALLKGTNTIVHCIPLDDILADLPKVDFIKMDIDGSEPQALKGLEKTIAKNKDLKLIIEFYPKYLKAAGNSPEELLALLTKDFAIEKIEKDYGDEYWNYLCIRKQ